RGRDSLAARPHLVLAELAPRARLEAGGGEPRVAAAMEPADGMVDGFEHPLDLVLAALVDRELDARGSKAARAGGSGDAVVELDASLERGQRLVGRIALDLGLVDLLHLVARMREPVREVAVV